MTTIEIKHKTADNLFRAHQLLEALEIQTRIIDEIMGEIRRENMNLISNMALSRALAEVDDVRRSASAARMCMDLVNKGFQNREIICKE